jgi:hypothetical protein
MVGSEQGVDGVDGARLKAVWLGQDSADAETLQQTSSSKYRVGVCPQKSGRMWLRP